MSQSQSPMGLPERSNGGGLNAVLILRRITRHDRGFVYHGGNNYFLTEGL